jgi:hypothetical protein
MSNALIEIEPKSHRRKAKMKKVISTIVVTGLISSMLVNTAFAGDHHGVGFNPLWVPVAILSTVAATVATIVQAPFVSVHQEYAEPRQTVIYEEPRQYRREHYYDRGPAHDSYYERGRFYEQPRYRDYR